MQNKVLQFTPVGQFMKSLISIHANEVCNSLKKRRNNIMELKTVATDKAPAAIGPYSQAIVCGNIVFTSGQIPINPATGAVETTTIEEQAKQVMQNLGAVLAAAGSSFEKAVKTTCFLADMNDFAAFNAVYAEYFTTKPARSCVAVKTLPKNVLVEVEVIATV
jgi:2-iminobutanoate/2-iminopropanoate deaminase